MRVFRVYTDTSVFGGPFDAEFAEPSKAFFARVARGDFRLVISRVVADELSLAPEEVRMTLDAIPTGSLEYHEVSEEMERLQTGYLSAGVVGPASRADALHVAAATVLGADMIVSWNFKHIVNYQRIRGFNAVNLSQGYRTIDIYSPLEVAEP